MATEFDYDSPDEVSAETIAGIVADMSGKPDNLTDEQREQRQLDHWRFLEQCRVRAEQERFERNLAKAEAEAAKESEARRQEAIARAERNRQLQEQMRLDRDRQMRDRQLNELHSASIRNDTFLRRNFDVAKWSKKPRSWF